MVPSIPEDTDAGIGRSCDARSDWVRTAPAAPGVERIEARFSGHGYDPHRHDTYALGLTVEGVQSFRYRGRFERSLAGQAYVLHPDETHDGSAGTDDGFRYFGIYVDPDAVRMALEGKGRALPFVRDVVSSDRRLVAAVAASIGDLSQPLEDLERDQIVLDIAEALAGVARAPEPGRGPAHAIAVRRARELIEASLPDAVASSALEAATGLSRFALARGFREMLGTSPHRYLVLRRLDRARALIRGGATLADAAIASGFVDQSHLNRQFKRAYGLTPGRWANLTR